MPNHVKFPNGMEYYTDSALAVCATGVVARANIETLLKWGEEEYGSDYAERATHYRFNRPEAEEGHAGKYPVNPLVLVRDGRMSDEAAIWVRADVWERWELQKSMENYPVLDEKQFALCEALAITEAWQTWVADEVESRLAQAGFADAEIESVPVIELREMFDSAMFSTGASYVEQSGGSMWVDVNEVMPVFLTMFQNKMAKEAVL